MPTMRLTPAVLFKLLLDNAGITGYEAEYRFSERRWRWDFAWPHLTPPVAVEVDEETSHGRWYKLTQDRQKQNAATLLGWRLLRFSGAMLRDDPDTCVAQLRELLGCGAVPI